MSRVEELAPRVARLRKEMEQLISERLAEAGEIDKMAKTGPLARRDRRIHRRKSQHGWSVAEMAAGIGVSHDTITRRIKDGTIPVKVFGPKIVRIPNEVARALIEHGFHGLPAWVQQHYLRSKEAV